LPAGADRTTPIDYTRFVHLWGLERGMVAQFDSPPLGGGNPKHSWVPGETVGDAVVLRIDPAAPPGDYELSIGFYDPKTGGKRLPLLAPSGERLRDDAAVLTTVRVGK